GDQPMTRADFAKSFRAMPADIQSRQDIKEIGVSGDLAYCYSHITVTMGERGATVPFLPSFEKSAANGSCRATRTCSREAKNGSFEIRVEPAGWAAPGVLLPGARTSHRDRRQGRVFRTALRISQERPGGIRF